MKKVAWFLKHCDVLLRIVAACSFFACCLSTLRSRWTTTCEKSGCQELRDDKRGAMINMVNTMCENLVTVLYREHLVLIILLAQWIWFELPIFNHCGFVVVQFVVWSLAMSNIFVPGVLLVDRSCYRQPITCVWTGFTTHRSDYYWFKRNTTVCFDNKNFFVLSF